MDNRKRGQHLVWLVLTCLLLLPLTAVAEGTSPSYTYNYWEQAVPTAPSYLPEKVLYGTQLGVEALVAPQDLYVTDEGEIVILDSGNSRLVVLNANMTLNRVIQPVDAAGTPLAFQDATGVFVCTDGRLLIADKKAQLVYLLDRTGRQIGTLTAPSSGVLPPNFQYQPIRVLEDSAGILYVVSAGCYSGALQFDVDHSFMGFYASEKVVLDAKTKLSYFWKNFLTEKQAEGLGRTVPVEFISFCVDKKDFIYTIRRGNDVQTGQVRKLNARGDNVLPDTIFGDHISNPLLTDIAVDDEGFIHILDSSSGRIFQYDQESTLLYAYGAKGEQAGCFATATAIETLGDKVLVLDSERGSLTMFAPTAFAKNVRSATRLYADGKYAQAMEPWKQVLACDYQYEQANLGLGKAYEGLGEYQTAMRYYRLGNDRSLYSDAFREYRAVFLRQYFVLLLVFFVAAIVALMVFISRRQGVKEVYAGGRPRRQYPLYCMCHPITGYEDMKWEKSGSFGLSGLLLLAFVLCSILQRQSTGFIFNPNRTDRFHLLVMLCSTVGIFIAFVLCNWAITTIMDGKGKFMEIWTFCAYALLPYIVLTLVTIGISNVLTLDESAFYTMAQVVAYGWTGLAMLMAIKEVHQYSLGKTLVTLLFTFVAMIIVVVIIAILYSVFSQFIGFLATVLTEIRLQ